MKIFGFRRIDNTTKITIFGKKFFYKHYSNKVITQNYTKKIQELQNIWGKRKIKVGFLVNEQAKWQYESLYKEMEKSDYFEPVVLVTQLSSVHRGKKTFYKSINECYNFFKNKGLNVRCVYDVDKKKYVSSKNFGVDILFYQQPWQLDDSQHPAVASQKSLTCYVPYGLHLVEFDGSYMEEFHELLWLMFIENDSQIQRFSKLVKHSVSNCDTVGYPKLDAYFSEKNTKIFSDEKPVVIYAPHHSFGEHSLNCATFQSNGLRILELAKKYHKQINWIFKPHPRFKTSVVSNKIMTEEEIDIYYRQWEELGVIYDSGDYISLFITSDGLITDCISFLGEYLPSEKPIFHLIAENWPFNEFAETFINSYYKINNIAELDSCLDQVIIKHKDTKKEERLSKIPLLFDKKEPTSIKILKKLSDSLGGKKCKL